MKLHEWRDKMLRAGGFLHLLPRQIKVRPLDYYQCRRVQNFSDGLLCGLVRRGHRVELDRRDN